jgi:hypothetical protein
MRHCEALRSNLITMIPVFHDVLVVMGLLRRKASSQ